MSAGVPLFSFETITNLHVIKHYFPSKTVADELCFFCENALLFGLRAADTEGWRWGRGGTLDPFPSSHKSALIKWDIRSQEALVHGQRWLVEKGLHLCSHGEPSSMLRVNLPSSPVNVHVCCISKPHKLTGYQVNSGRIILWFVTGTLRGRDRCLHLPRVKILMIPRFATCRIHMLCI